jgi:hypothetical protein
MKTKRTLESFLVLVLVFAIYVAPAGAINSLDANDGNPTDVVYVDNDGNVGIGTTEPRVKLSLGAEIPPNPKNLAIWDGDNDFYGFGAELGRITIYTNNTEKMTILSDGRVGIGITNPSGKLDVVGGHIILRESTEESAKRISLRTSGALLDLTAENSDLFIQSTSGNTVIQPWGGNVGIGTGSTNPAAKLHLYTGTFLLGASGSKQLRMRDTGNAIDIESVGVPLYINNTTGQETYLMGGNVGIGTTSPSQKLDVDGGDILVRGPQSFDSPGEQGTLYLGSVHNYIKAEYGFGVKIGTYAVGDVISICQISGNVGIGTTSPGAKLEVNGTTRTKVLVITGGADIAEPIPISDSGQIPRGSVVVIDEKNPGQLKLSDRPYDKKVAGVVSGAGGLNPGLTLGQQGIADKGVNIALSGRVYALVDTSNGPICPGDQLTTSDIPGHAMKVTDHGKAQGAVIGKAMTPLKEGRGLVLILVSLQ